MSSLEEAFLSWTGEPAGPLGVRIVPDGVVYPTIRVPSHPDRLLMGVYDGAGGYVEDSVLNRRAGERGYPVPTGLFPDIVDGAPEAIFGGPLYFHFGHFLLESLARAWYAKRHPGLPLIWAGAHTWQGKELTGWQREILDILGVTNPVVIAADPTRVARLHVPDIGYRYDDWCHPEHADFLASYEGPAQVPGHRLWLSRSRLDNEVRDFSAGPTERRLAAAGWTVSHPETRSVREQLDDMSRAELVAGEEGSAFHTLLLLKDIQRKRFRVLRRHGTEHRNMSTVGEARDVDQTFVSPLGERYVKVEGRVVSKLNPSSSEILDLFEVPVTPAGSATAPADLDAPLLKRVASALAPPRALEVGVRVPSTALADVEGMHVLVSPRLDVDPRVLGSAGTEVFELDLSQYAETFHDDRGRFDLIRLAAPDLASRMADFEVSQRLAHPRTVWVLGTGSVAARAALAVHLLHPGFSVRQMRVGRRGGYVVHRVTGEPCELDDIAGWSAVEVRRRARLLPLLAPGSLHQSRLSATARRELRRVLPESTQQLLRGLRRGR